MCIQMIYFKYGSYFARLTRVSLELGCGEGAGTPFIGLKFTWPFRAALSSCDKNSFGALQSYKQWSRKNL